MDEFMGNFDLKNGDEVMVMLCELNCEGIMVIVVIYLEKEGNYVDCLVCLFDG